MNPLAATEGPLHRFNSSTKKPTIVFVPGLFHTPAHFGPLSRYLEKEGYENFALSLPSSGERAGTGSGRMIDDVRAIRRVLEGLVKLEEDVILVMHSYGAVPGCQAVTGLERSLRSKQGKLGGIISLVFVGGLIIAEGESLESTMLGFGMKTLPEYTMCKCQDPLLRPANTPSILYGPSSLFQDLWPEQAAHWSYLLANQSASISTARVRNTCWKVNIPITYIRCAKDARTEVMDMMLAKVKDEAWTMKEIQAGQAPFLSRVEEVGDMIIQAGKNRGGLF